jgi:hypothetical protein
LQYWKINYYKRQGIPFLPGIWPVLGNLPTFKKVMDIIPK